MGRYDYTKKIKDKKTGILKFSTTIYSRVSENNNDIFIITEEGDRLDELSFRFYKTTSLWW